MLKKLLSYGFVEGVSKGLNKLTFLILPFFLNDVDTFGVIGLIVSIEVLLPYFTLLGLERAVLRFYSDKDDLKSFEKSIFRIINIAHLLMLLLIFIVNQYIDAFFGIKIFPYVYLTLFLVYLQGINLVYLNIYRASNLHSKYFKNRLFLQILKFTLVIFFVNFVEGVMGYLIGGILAAFITNALFRTYKKNNDKFSFETSKTLLLFSWPFVFHSLASNLLGNADKFILERFLDIGQVGLYTFAYSFGTAVVFGFLGITVFIEPLVYKEKDECKRNALLDKFFILSLSVGVLFTTIIYTISEYLLPVIYKKDYVSVIYLIPLISVCYLLQPFYFKANYKLIYEKKSLSVAMISIISCVVNIILNIILIPKIGLLAAVYTTFISNVIQYMLFVLISNNFKIGRDFIELFCISIVIGLFIFMEISVLYIILFFIMYIVFIYMFRFKKVKVCK